MDINKYFSGNKVSEIRVGQSGANVYEVNGEQILKHVQRNMLKNDMFDTYKKEALFYQSKMNTSSEFWHEFLHGNPEDRVKGIFDKLINDFQMLESI